MQAPHLPTADLAEARRVLGVSAGVTAEELRAAYLARVRALHPDRFEHLGPAEVARATPRFREVVRAYHLLGAVLDRSTTATVADGIYRPRARTTASPYAEAGRVGTAFDTAA